MRYDTLHFLSFLDVIDILKKNPVTIRWKTNKITDNLKIPFSGVPYILLVKQRYQCHHWEDMHKKSKENYQEKKKERQTSDHCFIRSRKLSQPTKKLDCPLVFTVKKLLRFPEYKIKETQRKRTEIAAKLKKEITALSSAKNDLETFTKDEENKNSIKPLGRLEYICKFPDPNVMKTTPLRLYLSTMLYLLMKKSQNPTGGNSDQIIKK